MDRSRLVTAINVDRMVHASWLPSPCMRFLHESRMRFPRARVLWAHELQTVVDRSHGSRTFTNGCGHALGRSGAEITHREQAGVTGLERERTAAKGAPPSAELALDKRPIGEDEPAVVESRTSGEPAGSGFSADKGEQSGYGQGSLPARSGQAHRTERQLPLQTDDLGLGQYLDMWMIVERIDGGPR